MRHRALGFVVCYFVFGGDRKRLRLGNYSLPGKRFFLKSVRSEKVFTVGNFYFGYGALLCVRSTAARACGDRVRLNAKIYRASCVCMCMNFNDMEVK
jgi:hypothetical protein